MAQHLCIVSRDNPLLLGYLNIALEYLTRTGDELEIVIDRRPDPALEPTPGTVVAVEQRQLHGVDNLLRSRGYAIVSRAEGEGWRLTDAVIPIAGDEQLGFAAPSTAARAVAFGEPVRRGLERAAGASGEALRRGFGRAAGASGEALRRGRALAADTVPPPMRRRLALAVAAAGIVIGAASVAIKSDALDRVAGVTGDAIAWLRSTSGPETPVAAAPPAPTAPAPPAPAFPPVTPSGSTRTTEIAPPPAVTEGQAVRAAEPPAVGPARPAKLATHPPRTDPAPPQTADPNLAVPKSAVKAEPRLEPKATAAVVAEAPAEFSGVPRLEMRRERDAAGHTSAIAVRVTDAGGRPLRSADVRILRRINGGGIQETRLTPDPRDGSFRGAPPPATAESHGLSMRVTVGRVSHEVPIAE